MGTQKAYDKRLVEAYDSRHFGGKSGEHILRRDTGALASLLEPLRGPILDIPCGTGVYATAFMRKGYEVVAADASLPMLEVTRQREPGAHRVLCDIGQLPFRDGTFDAVMTIRLFSHYPKDDIRRMLLELKRAIKSGGRVVFDTFRWTPRTWPLFRRFLEESYIYVLPHRDVEELIANAGLTKVDEQHLYLFSPIWQRKLPFVVLRGLDLLETWLPQQWLLRTFWACTKD